MHKPVDTKPNDARPHSVEAETSVLGSIFLAPDVLDDVSLIVRAEDFYSPAHRKVYEHLSAMHDVGKRIDLMLVFNRIKKAGDLPAIGGMPFLEDLAMACPTAANATHYAKIIRDDATKRAVIQCGETMIADAFHTDDANGLLANSEARLFAIGESRFQAEVKPVAGVLAAAMELADERRQTKGAIGLKSGYPDLDKLTHGFRPAQLVIVAGRPHMGKTALATCLIENILCDGRKVLFISLEMNDQELGERLLAQRSRVPLDKILNGTTTPEERRELIKAQSELSEMSLTIDDHPSRTVADISALCRREKRRRGLDVVFIDYLTQIEPDNHRDPRQEQVAKLSRRLKGLARELKVPVIALAQLNRDVEKSDRAPKLSDLRESGAIEQDADVVLMLHRPECYAANEAEKRQLTGKTELHARKVRNGKLGTVDLVFFNDYGRFENCARGKEWNGEFT